MPETVPEARRGTTTRLAAALMLVMLVGAGARLVPWRQVFTQEGVQIAGTDSYYHLLRAENIVRDYPHVPWFDPWMNYPHGAPILWPPLFDQTIATATVATGGTAASPEAVRTVAAVVPFVFGMLTLPLVAAIAATLVGAEAGVVAALAVALLPAHVYYSEVGRPDQHVAETFFFCWVALAFLAGCLSGEESGRRRWTSHVLLGLGIAHAFWNWMGSGLNLLFLLGIVALWHLMTPADDPVARRGIEALWRGSVLAAVFLATSMLLWAPRGALLSMELSGLTGFHLSLIVMTAAFGGILSWLRGRGPDSGLVRRILHLALAGGAPLLAVVVILPGFRDEIARALRFIGRTGPWYESIAEFQPVFFGGNHSIGTEIVLAGRFYGLGLIAMPLILVPMLLRYRRNPRERPALLFLLLWGLAFLILALARRRFDNYFSVPLGIWLAFGWRELLDGLGAKWRRRWLVRALAFGALAIVLAPTLPALVEKWKPRPHPRAELFQALGWLREAEPPRDREAVLAGWDLGHHVEYFAKKPVVVNPFGTDLGPGPMEDAAAFFLARSESRAEEVLARRRVGFVLLRNPSSDAAALSGFAAAGTEAVIRIRASLLEEKTGNVLPEFWELVATRLYFFEGTAQPDKSLGAVGGFRLLYESPTNAPWGGVEAKLYKIFGTVEGAKAIVESDPGREVKAVVHLRTNQNRDLLWNSSARTRDDGVAVLRLPYATGANGAVVAMGAYHVNDGRRQARLSLTDAQVVEGAAVRVALQ